MALFFRWCVYKTAILAENSFEMIIFFERNHHVLRVHEALGMGE